jgi:hypothetical protein
LVSARPDLAVVCTITRFDMVNTGDFVQINMAELVVEIIAYDRNIQLA